MGPQCIVKVDHVIPRDCHVTNDFSVLSLCS